MKDVLVGSVGCLVTLLIASPMSGRCNADQRDSSIARERTYTITDLNIPVRTWDHGARSINNNGEIVGTLDKPDGTCAAFHYRNGVLTELPRLDGTESQAISINNRGQIAGTIKRPSRNTSGTQVGVVWDKGSIREIGPAPTRLAGSNTHHDVTISAINDLGEVLGYVSGWESTYTPFVWLHGVILEPKQYEAAEQGKLASAPRKANVFLGVSLGFIPKGINGRGQVVGTSSGRAGGSASHAMMWHNGKQWNLGALPGGEFSRAVAINNRGEVAGTSSVEGIYADHAFLWRAGKMHDLGTHGGRSSEASAINNRGDVVGWADIHYTRVDGKTETGWGGDRAMLWHNGNAYNLNDLVPKSAGWVLERAVAINDKGQIIGVGRLTAAGGMRCFLLTPVSR